MKKKIIIAISLILIVALLLVGCTKASEGSIVNGGFDSLTNNSPDNWTLFKDTSGKAEYTVNFEDVDINTDESKELVSGKYIKFNVANDYGVYQYRQNVKLESGKIYKLTYSINVLDDFSNYNYNTKVGMFVGILEGATNKEFYNSSKTGEWKSRDVYFEVENPGTYVFAAGVGFKDNGARGAGLLDNIKLSSVDSAPAGISTVIIENAGISDGKTEGILYTVFLSLFTLIACVFVYYLVKHYNHKDLINPVFENAPADDNDGNNKKSKKTKKVIADDGQEASGAVPQTVTAKPNKERISAKKIFTSSYAIFSYSLIGMFLIRFLIAYFSAGMANQLTELGELALKIQDVGIGGIYATTTLPIQYGMMYIYAAVGGIADMAGLGSSSLGMYMLLRLPQLIADLVIYYLIFTMLTKHIGQKQGAIVACLFGLLPAVFSLSSAWGMNSSIPMAFIVATVYAMINKNLVLAIVMSTLALMFNVNAVIVLPVLFMFLGYYLWKDKSVKNYIAVPTTIISCLVVFYCLALPFTLNFVKDGNFFFVFQKMGTIFASNVKLTNDVFNMYAIFGTGNSVTSTTTSVVTSLIMIGLIVGGFILYLKSKNRLDWMGLTGISFLSYAILGVGASFDMMIIGIVVLMLYAMLRNDKRLYKIFSIFAVLTLINIGLVMISSGVLGSNPIFQALFKTDWMYILGSILSVATLAYLLVVMFDIMSNDFIYEIEPMKSFKEEIKSYKLAIENKFKKK